jgi:CBS-domain-containing membrane protein
LHEHGLHIAPVIDDAGRPIGVVSRTDLLDYWSRRRDRLAALAAGEINTVSVPGDVELPGDELTIRAIMTPVVFGVRSNASMESIVEKTVALEVRCLFVTDSEGVLVGTVKVFDVLRHLARSDAQPVAAETPNSAASASVLRKRFGIARAMPP